MKIYTYRIIFNFKQINNNIKKRRDTESTQLIFVVNNY